MNTDDLVVHVQDEMNRKCANCGRAYGFHLYGTQACPIMDDIGNRYAPWYDDHQTFKESDDNE